MLLHDILIQNQFSDKIIDFEEKLKTNKIKLNNLLVQQNEVIKKFIL